MPSRKINFFFANAKKNSEKREKNIHIYILTRKNNIIKKITRKLKARPVQFFFGKSCKFCDKNKQT